MYVRMHMYILTAKNNTELENDNYFVVHMYVYAAMWICYVCMYQWGFFASLVR